MHGLDVVLVAGDACALRSMVDDIDEVGIVGLFDGSRNGKAGHAEEAEVCGHHGGTDGTVGGDGVGFDEDGGFHIVRSLELAVRSDSPARWAPPLRGGWADARCPGVETPG